jgi:hypothetical protein
VVADLNPIEMHQEASGYDCLGCREVGHERSRIGRVSKSLPAIKLKSALISLHSADGLECGNLLEIMLPRRPCVHCLSKLD